MNKPVKVKGFVAVDSCGDKTDAFIEKACEWMSSHMQMQYSGFSDFIKDFRKAMKNHN